MVLFVEKWTCQSQLQRRVLGQIWLDEMVSKRLSSCKHMHNLSIILFYLFQFWKWNNKIATCLLIHWKWNNKIASLLGFKAFGAPKSGLDANILANGLCLKLLQVFVSYKGSDADTDLDRFILGGIIQKHL